MGGQWLLPQVEGLAPYARGGHACVAVGTKLLVFGGSDRTPVTYDDLWVLETAGGKCEWTRITPIIEKGCSIHQRSGASLTTIGDQVYLFGGQEPLTEFRFGDLKVLDTSSWTWREVAVSSSTTPPARHSHAMGCLSGQCLLLYGGSGYSGALGDVWIFNPATSGWQSVTVTAAAGVEVPPPREMHSLTMVSPTTAVIYGGRGTDGRVLCDAALLDVSASKWLVAEPTPFSRCAHCTGAAPRSLLRSSSTTTATGSGGGGDSAGAELQGEGGPMSVSGEDVLVYGGFSGEAVEGDVLRIDSQTLEVEMLHRGPRESDPPRTVPPARFAHAGACVPWASGTALVAFGGVNPAEDLADVAVWLVTA